MLIRMEGPAGKLVPSARDPVGGKAAAVCWAPGRLGAGQGFVLGSGPDGGVRTEHLKG